MAHHYMPALSFAGSSEVQNVAYIIACIDEWGA